MDGDEALEADGDGHEDGGHEGDLVERVQQVREQDDVQPERKRQAESENRSEKSKQRTHWGL